MLSLQRNTGLEHPWFARPVMPTYTRVPHRQHHEFLAVSDESASASTTSTEEYSIYKSYKSSNNKKVSESRHPQLSKLTEITSIYLQVRHKGFFKNYENSSILSRQFLQLFPHFNIADPRCWSREDVQTWIRHLAAVHNLPAVQPDRFLMNGKALCLMTMEMFCQRVPLGGKMLYKDFQLRLSMAMYGDSNNNN